MYTQSATTIPQTPPAHLLAIEAVNRQITPYHRDHALVALFPFVYGGLSQRVRQRLRRTTLGLDAATLVHGLYRDSVASGSLKPTDRAYMLAVSALAMRQALVAEARKRRSTGGSMIDAADGSIVDGAVCLSDVLEVHGALQTLAKHKVEWVSLVECRYFAGLSAEDTALALNIPIERIHQAWPKVTTWLQRFLSLPAMAA